MLSELRVQNLLLIERAELRLGLGLNVLTGETGAGKTVLAHALDLLLGGRARTAIVRPGAREAYVEGIFELPGDSPVVPLARALSGGPSEADASSPTDELGGPLTIALARRVGTDGRTRAYLNGRSLALADLRELGALLISFYGQHEHRKLTLASAQLEILDAYCGPDQVARLTLCRTAHERLRALHARREQLGGADPTRELELLEHEIAEIEAAEISNEEHALLLERRERLSRLEALRQAAGAATEALSDDASNGAGATQLMAAGARGLETLQGVDTRLDELAERYRCLVIDAQELAGELRHYGEELAEEDEQSLASVRERLEVFARLIRKHGGTLEAVLEHLRWAVKRRSELLGTREAAADLEDHIARQETTLAAQAAELRRARSAAAPALARAVRKELGALAMDGAVFAVRLGARDLGPTGNDSVEMVIAPNPGVPAGPLREIASGGELSRIMLALSVARRGPANRKPTASGQPTLVFDEIDAGIGGQTARAVGERLRTLAEDRQILCITHLPQIASMGARHFAIVKDTGACTARASVVELSEPQVLSELVRMLGAPEHDHAAQRHAEALRRAA